MFADTMHDAGARFASMKIAARAKKAAVVVGATVAGAALIYLQFWLALHIFILVQTSGIAAAIFFLVVIVALLGKIMA